MPPNGFALLAAVCSGQAITNKRRLQEKCALRIHAEGGQVHAVLGGMTERDEPRQEVFHAFFRDFCVHGFINVIFTLQNNFHFASLSR